MIIALLVFEFPMRPARMLLLRATATFRADETSPDDDSQGGPPGGPPWESTLNY